MLFILYPISENLAAKKLLIKIGKHCSFYFSECADSGEILYPTIQVMHCCDLQKKHYQQFK